jgi:hypothetical protein
VTDPLIEKIKETMLEVLDRKLFLGPRKFFFCYRPAGWPSSRLAPAREFLDSLSDEVKASYAVQFRRHCDGDVVRGDKHHPWWPTDSKCEGISAYKDISSKTRVVHITDREHLQILLFGFSGKKEDDVETCHVVAAKRWRDEYRQRRLTLEKQLKKVR